MDPRFITDLTQATQVDGVYIYEIDPPGYIRGQGVSVVGCVGEFERGPVDQVITIGSSAEFRRIFGGYGRAAIDEIDSFRGYSGFRALSGKFWPSGIRVVRTSRTGMAKATGTIKIPSGEGYRVVTITAKWLGAYGNRISAAVSIASDTSLEDGIRIAASLDDQSETVDNLYAGIPGLALQERLKDLQIVDVSIGAETNGAPDALPAIVTLSTGSDGNADVLAKWTGGIDLLLAQRDLNILFYAEPPGGTVTFAALNSHIKGAIVPTSGNAQFVMAILAGPSGDTINTAATAASGLRSDRIVYAFPWRKQVYADASPTHPGGVLLVPSNDIIASALANIDPLYDPASRFGTDFIDAATVGLEFPSLTRVDYVTANQKGVCALEFDPDLGYRIVSGITTDLTPAKEMIHRRRLADYLIRSISTFLKFYQNQPITQDWKDEILGAIHGFLLDQQTLTPTPRVLEFEIDTESVNEPATEAQGIYRILMKVRVPASARYIVLLSQVGTTVEVKQQEDQLAAAV